MDAADDLQPAPACCLPAKAARSYETIETVRRL